MAEFVKDHASGLVAAHSTTKGNNIFGGDIKPAQDVFASITNYSRRHRSHTFHQAFHGRERLRATPAGTQLQREQKPTIIMQQSRPARITVSKQAKLSMLI